MNLLENNSNGVLEHVRTSNCHNYNDRSHNLFIGINYRPLYLPTLQEPNYKVTDSIQFCLYVRFYNATLYPCKTAGDKRLRNETRHGTNTLLLSKLVQ